MKNLVTKLIGTCMKCWEDFLRYFLNWQLLTVFCVKLKFHCAYIWDRRRASPFFTCHLSEFFVVEENSDLIRAMTTYYDLLRIESLSSKLCRYALSHNKVLFSLIIKYTLLCTLEIITYLLGVCLVLWGLMRKVSGVSRLQGIYH